MKNIFDTQGIPQAGGEWIEILARQGAVDGWRLERIVSLGEATPPGEWYDQSQWEWVVLIQGAARLRYEDGRMAEFRCGDCLTIAPHERHRVEYTSSDAVWLALHYDKA